MRLLRCRVADKASDTPTEYKPKQLKTHATMEERIKAYLDERAQSDPTIAANLKKATKSIERCCKYIRQEAQKQAVNGCAMIEDDVVFGWALHYYDEDNMDIDKEPQKKPIPTSTKVVSMPKATKTEKTADKPQKQAEKQTEKQTAKVVQLDLF